MLNVPGIVSQQGVLSKHHMHLFLFQRVGERFLDLDVSSVLVAAMDVTLETPPPEVAITLPTLPAIVLLAGDNKEAPFRCEGLHCVHPG